MQRSRTKDEMFEEIYRTYQHDVYKISLYYAGEEHIAHDIVQKSFYKFYLHFEHIDLDKARSYLLRSARNLSFNWLRDMKREYEGEYIDNIPENILVLHSAEDEYLKGEKSEARRTFVKGILMRLQEENESWYDIITLIYLMNKPHSQVAEELGMTPNALYCQLRRAKNWIRKHYEEEFFKL